MEKQMDNNYFTSNQAVLLVIFASYYGAREDYDADFSAVTSGTQSL